MERRSEIPPFMDLRRWWVKWGVGLGVGIPAAVLMLLVYGMTPLGFGFAVGESVLCVGSVYLIDRLGRMID